MKHIHLIGIGGTGLSAIALFLKERGYTVSGSDRVMSPLARRLAEQGVVVYTGHDAKNIANADAVELLPQCGTTTPNRGSHAVQSGVQAH